MMKNSKYENKFCVILVLFMIMALFFFFDQVWAIDKAYAEDDALDKKFKSLGIITLSGIAPPEDYVLMDMGGNPVKLSDFQGKIVFLNFWTTWCPDCVDEMPDIENLHKKLKSKAFIIIAVDLKESEKKVKKFMAKHGLTYKILLDKKGDMGRAFNVRSIPSTYILNRKGGLIGRALGTRDWDSKKSVNLFEYLLKTY